MYIFESFHEFWINLMKILLQGVKGKVKLEGSWKMDQEECNQKCNEAREIAPLKRDIEDSIYFFSFLVITKSHISPSTKGQKISEANFKVFIWTKNEYFLYFCPKSQLISKRLFGNFNSSKKRTKKFYLMLNCFSSFFGRIEDTKKTFRN